MNLPFLCHMALVTIQRSPSAIGYPPSDQANTLVLDTPDGGEEVDDKEVEEDDDEDDDDDNTEVGSTSAHAIAKQRSISETCYFALKGTAVVLPHNDSVRSKYRKSSAYSGDIQQHLQSMFYLLRQEDTLKMAVKLESIHSGRTRYLVVVSCSTAEGSGPGEATDCRRPPAEENCLLGVDYNDRATIGLVLPVFADTQITLDGDGGFSVSSTGRHHIFKPVSVQAMWSALQTLHKASSKARECNYYMGGLTHAWIDNYERKVGSDRSCLNEWVAMDNLESRRPPSPDCLRSRPRERAITEKDIRLKLKEIMMTVDLDEVTSKFIRTRLEEELDINLQEYKSFIDEEMITILGQMDAATQIFDFLYLGSEWNASNLEELQKNGVGHILNVTREIDNFFPGMFHYQNIRVYDDEGTELLKHWDTTYKFINNARENNSKVLVHCKMGVSRSASVVIAYAMKAHSWNMQKALAFVKSKRTCVKPNHGFMKQLEVYQGILDASKHRHNQLWRSKSENNLNKAVDDSRDDSGSVSSHQTDEPKDKELLYLDMPTPITHAGLHAGMRSSEPAAFPCCHRPKSWSPDDNIADMLFPQVDQGSNDGANPVSAEPGQVPAEILTTGKSRNHVLLPCRDGKQYSVSPNKALHLDMTPAQASGDGSGGGTLFQVGSEDDDSPVLEVVADYGSADAGEEVPGEATMPRVATVKRVSSIKDRINELESQAQLSAETRAPPTRERLDLPENTGLVLNLTYQFEAVGSSKSTPASPIDIDDLDTPPSHPPPPIPTAAISDMRGNEPVVSQTKPAAARHMAVLVRPETWVEGGTIPESSTKTQEDVIVRLLVNQQMSSMGQPDSKSVSGEENVLVPAAEAASPTTVAGRVLDPFSQQLDSVFAKQEAEVRKSDEQQQQSVTERTFGISSVPCSRQDSWGSSDSAISLHLPEAQRDSPASRRSSRASTSESGQGATLSREGSWGAGDARRPRASNGLNGPAGYDDAEHLLKRTGSFDCALRSTLRSATAATADSPNATTPSKLHAVGSGVQRSQSLRTTSSAISCTRHAVCADSAGSASNDTIIVAGSEGSGRSAGALNLRRRPTQPNPTYGPTPYRSPTENREFQPFSAKVTVATASPTTTTTTTDHPIVPVGVEQRQPPQTPQQPSSPHYGSTPILYRAGMGDAASVAVLHSSSQPNITFAMVARPPRSPVARPPQHVASSPPACSPDVVPGIVKQNKEILESFIRETARDIAAADGSTVTPLSTRLHPVTMPTTSSTTTTTVRTPQVPPPPPPLPPPPPPPPTRHSSLSLSDEWRQIQRRLRKLGRTPSREADTDTRPSPSVRRITEEMEAKRSAGPVPITGGRDSGAGDVTSPAQLGNVVIVDKFGNEVSATGSLDRSRVEAAVTTLSNSTSVSDRTTADGSGTSSGAARPAVRVLVDRFKVREEQLVSRPRYYSENEAVNLQWVADEEMASHPATAAPDRVPEAASPGLLRRKINLNGGAENSLKRMSLLCCHVGSGSSSGSTTSVDTVGGNLRGGGTDKGDVAANMMSRPPLATKAPVDGGGGGSLLLLQQSLLTKKVRKAQGKSHPLTRLPPCKPTHSTI